MRGARIVSGADSAITDTGKTEKRKDHPFMNHTSEPLLTIPRDFRFGENEADALELDCGRKLQDVNLRYECVGELAPDGGNAVLILHALSGDAHVCGRHTPEDRKPGWWDDMVGPGKPIDTNRYFVICSNVLGSCAGS